MCGYYRRSESFFFTVEILLDCIIIMLHNIKGTGKIP